MKIEFKEQRMEITKEDLVQREQISHDFLKESLE
jgi:hypothetical protein